MKTLKDYAREHGIKYRAAWNRYKLGKIPGACHDEFGRILIPVSSSKPEYVVCYARDLMKDFVSLVTSFTARLYGLRRSKRKAEQLIRALEEKIKKT